MALELKDRIYTECVGTGTGTVEITDTKEGYQGWESLDNGAHTYYCIIDNTSWEVGHGRYTNSGGKKEITRNLLTSNTGALLNLSGNASIFCTYPAEKSVYLDLDGNLDFPEVNVKFNNVIGNQVASPVVVTEAVIVDGTEGLNDSNLAGLLNVYTKDEIDKQQEAQDEAIDLKAPQATTYTKTEVDDSQKAQDTKIDKNKTDIKTNKDNIAENKDSIEGLAASLASTNNDVIELEEEIEALAPSFDRGHWKHDPVEGMAGGSPIESGYYLAGSDAQIVQKFEETHQVYFHNVDAETPPQTHTFDDVTEGMYMELFEGSDSSFLLGVVETVTKGTSHTVIDVTVVKAEGGPGAEEEEQPENPDVSASGVPGVIRVKFFTMAEGELDLDAYMQKSGGTFTGSIGTNRGNVLIKSGNKNSGTSFSVINGNDVEQLSINGYGNFEYKKPTGIATTDDTVARLGDITAASELVTLTTAGDMFVYYHSTNQAPVSNYFSANLSDTKFNTTWHLNNLKDERSANVMCKDYEATKGTMLEIWKEGTLRVKTTLRAWEPSSRGNNCIQAVASGSKPSVALGATLAHGSDYQIIVTNLRKK